MDAVTDVQESPGRAPAGGEQQQASAGLPVYERGKVPEPLATMTQLKAQRLKPAKGQKPKGLLSMYRRGHGWGTFELYDPAEAQAMRPLSAKQQAAKTARRTCPACGELQAYIVYQRCTECRRKANAEAEDRRGRTCTSCGRVSAGPLRSTGHGVPASPRCVPCWFAVALRVQAREEAAARWRRSCPECGAQTATNDEAAQALAETGSWTPRCCPPCAVVRAERRAVAEQRMREAAEEAERARAREVRDLEAWARAVLEDDLVVVVDTETTGLEDDARIVDIAVTDRHGAVLLDTLINPGVAIPWGASDIHGITDADVVGAPSFSEVLPRLEEVLAGRRCLIYNAPYDTARLEHELTLHHRDRVAAGMAEQTAGAAAAAPAGGPVIAGSAGATVGATAPAAAEGQDEPAGQVPGTAAEQAPLDGVAEMRAWALEQAPTWAREWMAARTFEDVMIPYSDWVGDWSDYWGNYAWQPLPGGDHRALGDCRAVIGVLKEMAAGGGFEFPEGGEQQDADPWATTAPGPAGLEGAEAAAPGTGPVSARVLPVGEGAG